MVDYLGPDGMYHDAGDSYTDPLWLYDPESPDYIAHDFVPEPDPAPGILTYHLQTALGGAFWTDCTEEHTSLHAAMAACDLAFDEADQGITVRVKGSDGISYYRRNATHHNR